MAIVTVPFPENTNLIHKKFDYSDSFSGKVTKDFLIESAAKTFFNTAPGWVQNLMRLRNRIVKYFGLKVSDIPEDPDEALKSVSWESGEKIGLWQIFYKSETEIIVGHDDKHLDFRVSFLKKQSSDQIELTLTTIVVFNNLFGKIYFIPVKLFHKPIVKAMLKNIVKELSGN